jgi:hypothetical protein
MREITANVKMIQLSALSYQLSASAVASFGGRDEAHRLLAADSYSTCLPWLKADS